MRIRTRGFSLIEIIVAVGVFTVVAMLTIGSLFILTSAEKRVASVQANQDNVRFTMEPMAREIRTGSAYAECGGVPASCFQFDTITGDTIEYSISSSPADCAPGAQVNCVLRSVNAGTAYPITSPEVSIERLNFYVAGIGSDDVQPHVTVVLEGVAQKGTPNETKIDSQTTVSALLIDY